MQRTDHNVPRITTSRPYIVTNVNYATTIPGILKCCEVVLGIICLALITYYCNRDLHGEGVYSGFRGSSSESYFFLVTFHCFLGTVLLFVSCTISLATATVLPKTIVEVAYHTTASILYFTSSISVLIVVIQRNKKLTLYREQGYAGFIAAGTIGLINTGLYITSFVFSYKAFKGI